jgi:hypothetical protein
VLIGKLMGGFYPIKDVGCLLEDRIGCAAKRLEHQEETAGAILCCR